MSIKRALLLTLLLQGGGGFAALLAALWIGRTLGAAQQGQFNQIKSLVDLGAALAALGMPQAIYVFVQSGRMSLRCARWWSVGVALVGLPVGLALAQWNGLVGSGLAVGLAVSVALACLYSQWRTLVLLSDASWRFNVVTAVPQLLLLPLAFGVVRSGGVDAGAVAQAMAVVWFLAGCYALRELAHIPETSKPVGAPSFGALLRHGLATWAAICLAAFAIVMLQKTALSLAGPDALGRVSLALLLAQVPLTPLNYTLPLLLRYRLRKDQSGGESGRAFRFTRYMPLAAAPMLLLSLLALALGQFRNDFWLGRDYAGLDRALAWMLVAGAAEAMMRVVSVDTQAEGRPWRSACAEAARVVVFMALGFWGASSAGAAMDATGVAVLWAVATWTAALTLWALNRKDRS